MTIFQVPKKHLNSFNMIRIDIEPYSALSASSPGSHSSLSPTICHCVGFFHLLTALNCARVSTHFGCVGFLGFQVPGGSARPFSSHTAVAWVLHALYEALRSLRALEASLLLSLATLASSSASKAEIIASPMRIHPALVHKSCWDFFFQPCDFSFAAKASHNFLQWRSWRTLYARTVW